MKAEGTSRMHLPPGFLQASIGRLVAAIGISDVLTGPLRDIDWIVAALDLLQLRR
jgi:hypothetical protein